jgi:hypothetical protein
MFFQDGGTISFFDHSTAGNAALFLRSLEGGAFVRFADSSNAGSATINLRASSDDVAVFFEGSSKGGTAQIQFDSFPGAFFAVSLDISAHDAPG